MQEYKINRKEPKPGLVAFSTSGLETERAYLKEVDSRQVIEVTK